MRDIYKVLMEKRSKLLNAGDALAVEFTLDDINVLSDLNQLRTLKLKTPFPADYEPASDIFDCAQKVIAGEDVYRILEFCVRQNRVLSPHVTQVFKRLL